LTTLEGFDTLALSAHRDIASMGLIALVGILVCLLVALGTLPATLQIWSVQYYSKGQG
jgi:predicted RND superfamily exporter protein